MSRRGLLLAVAATGVLYGLGFVVTVGVDGDEGVVYLSSVPESPDAV